mgnify:FL=1
MIKIRNIKGIANKSACILLLLYLLPGCRQNNSDPALLKSAEVKTSEEKIEVKVRQGDPEKGKVVYEKYCFYCHGREGRGDGAIGIAVSPHPADFVGDKRKMAKSDEELIKSIAEGIHREVGSEEMAMPRWKDILSEEDMWNALAYVRELSRGKK